MRPPGAQPEFVRLCDGCGACARACPQGIIAGNASAGPEVRLDTRACTFCQDCARACPTGALAVMEQPGWDWRATVDATCLSMNGIACRACEDACDERAIRFRLMIGGRAAPGIDPDQCTGCGACAPVCPSGSIGFIVPEIVQEVRA
ncbi:MAG: ferredoxin-type protein NapF [Pseudooceanicola sp.]|nr:ferredoxin-type protein NapF [Pseudooceanicola sp.]